MWLTVKEVADLTGKTARAIRKRINHINDASYKTKKERYKGINNFRFLISFDSLTEDAQVEYFRRLERKRVEENDGLMKPPPAENLLRYTDQLDVILERVDIVKEAIRLKNHEDNSTQKIKALAQAKAISLATLYRWINAYETSKSITSLGRGGNSNKGIRTKISQQLADYAKSLYLDQRQPSISQVYRQVQTHCETEKITIPSYTSIRKIIKEEISPSVVCMARQGEMKWKDTYEPIIRRDFSGYAVNQLWFSDHHELDIYVEYNGRIVRPWITANMDARSRTIPGYHVALHPNSRTIALSLRHSILPKTREDYPNCGIPKEYYMDNGKDYRSHLIGGRTKRWGKIDIDKQTKGILDELGVKIHYAKPYYARTKIIERWFGTLEEEIRLLPGYCGRRYDFKPAKLKKELKNGSLLSFRRFCLELEQIIVEYHHRIHRTLKAKPHDEWVNNIIAPVIPDERSLDIILMKSGMKKVYSDGVHFFGGRRYWNTEFVEHRLIGKEVEVRYDPDEIKKVLIFRDEKYICDAYIQGYIGINSEKELIEKLKLQKKTRKQIKEIVRDMQAGQMPTRVFDLAEYTRGRKVRVPVKKVEKTRFDEKEDDDELFTFEFEREEALKKARARIKNKEGKRL